MLYVASRLFSTVQFDDEHDTKLWESLVPLPIEKMNETGSIRKFWMAGEVFCADNFQMVTFSINRPEERDIIQPARLTIQILASYLFIQQTSQQTIFTFLSPYQNALESLESLIASLYEPTEPARLDKFLLTNQNELSVRTVRFFDRKMGDEVQKTFAEPVLLSEATRKYSSLVSSVPKRNLLSLSEVSYTGEPSLSELTIDVDMRMNKVSFSIEDRATYSTTEEQALKEAERTQIGYFFTLADTVFNGAPLATAIPFLLAGESENVNHYDFI